MGHLRGRGAHGCARGGRRAARVERPAKKRPRARAKKSRFSRARDGWFVPTNASLSSTTTPSTAPRHGGGGSGTASSSPPRRALARARCAREIGTPWRAAPSTLRDGLLGVRARGTRGTRRRHRVSAVRRAEHPRQTRAGHRDRARGRDAQGGEARGRGRRPRELPVSLHRELGARERRRAEPGRHRERRPARGDPRRPPGRRRRRPRRGVRDGQRPREAHGRPGRRRGDARGARFPERGDARAPERSRTRRSPVAAPRGPGPSFKCGEENTILRVVRPGDARPGSGGRLGRTRRRGGVEGARGATRR